MVLVLLSNLFLNFLDLIAVALIGLLGSLAIRGLKSEGLGDRTRQVLELFQMDEVSFTTQIVLIGWISVTLFIIKSVGSFLYTRRAFLFLSYQSIGLSTKIVKFITKSPVSRVNSVGKQEHIFQITQGTNTLMMGILGTTFTLVSDIGLFIFMICMLLLVDTISALVSLVIFMLIGLSLNILFQEKSRKLGKESKETMVRSNEEIAELIGSFREIITRNSQDHYASSIYKRRISITRLTVMQKMMPLVSKYVVEIMVILLVVLVATFQFAWNDSSRAVGNMALFLAASSRIAPAVLRIQQGILQLKNSIGVGSSTINLLNEVNSALMLDEVESTSTQVTKIANAIPEIVFKSVNFRYEESSEWAIRNFNLTIEPGSFVAFVGPSGAGKSSIVDLMFGLLNAQSGQVLIGGLPARSALVQFPGEFGYVPQSIELVHGTFLDNLLLGIPRDFERLEIEDTLRLVGLDDFVNSLPKGLMTKLTEEGIGLSGGQKQRLGMARALIYKPRILVLDESTSSLDAISENLVSTSLNLLRRKITLVVIAHRLTTIRSADRIIYIDRGSVVGEGNFETLKKLVPEFDKQAELMGL